jgi:hypothetical protein
MDGYIIAGHNEAPWAVADTIPREKFPPTKWTDVVAVQWNQHVPAGSNLRRVYRSNVAYSQSKHLIESALEKVGKSGDLDELPLWPGVDFEPGDHPTVIPMEPATEAFMGLLGSSHAAWASNTEPFLARRGSTKSKSGMPRMFRHLTCYSISRTFETMFPPVLRGRKL